MVDARPIIYSVSKVNAYNLKTLAHFGHSGPIEVFGRSKLV